MKETRLICKNSLDRYSRIVQAIAPQATGMALCDSSGQAIHCVNFDDAAEILPAVQQQCERIATWASGAEYQLHATPGDTQFLLAVSLTNARDDIIGVLSIALPVDSQYASIVPSLKCTAECIENEMAMDAELDAMACELTERYEEINLVYHTEDQVNYFSEGQEALKNLTQNCLEYLDVSLVAMILRGKDVAIFSHNDTGDSLTEGDLVQSKLGSDFYDWVTGECRTVVINDMSDPLACELLPGAPYKVLGCPIIDSNGGAIGILATANNYSKKNYSNSDRNLLEVMARKASKIIVANYDALTGLINRNGYEHFLESAFSEVRATKSENSLLHINIDHLHIINDTVSHAAGDAVICGIATIINAQTRDRDTHSRLGGDEFGVLLHDCPIKDGVEFAERICREVEGTPIEFEGASYNATVSIGVTVLTVANTTVAQAVVTAELASTMAKDQGRNRVETYRQDNIDMISREEQMHQVAVIQGALSEDRFELHCQEIQPLAPGAQTHHTEVLLRLLDERGDIVLPDTFIPAAERYQLMPSIDRWVVGKTLAMLSEFDPASLRGGTYAINLSGQSFNEKGFLDFVHSELRTTNVPPECICFEVTETAAVANLTTAVQFMNSLRTIGCSFSLDDFGSGVSSFGYLRNLPVDYLKIDGMIVKDMVTDVTSAAMVAAINQVGHAMSLQTIAEYVETDAIKQHLRDLGVDYAQGFGIGRPEPFANRLHNLLLTPEAAAS